MSIPKIEFERAREWRLRLGLTPQQLSEAIGFSPEIVYNYERIATPQPDGVRGRPRTRKAGPVNEFAWIRYKRACGDLDAELHGRKKGVTFAW